MTVLSAQTIRERIWRTQNGPKIPRFGGPGNYSLGDQHAFSIDPFAESTQLHGMSFGLSSAGYDIRVGKMNYPVSPGQEFQTPDDLDAPTSISLYPGQFMLAASFERFKLPHDLLAIVHDKSTLARQGVALQNTVLEPGWEGWITLELSNHGPKPVRIIAGQPIAQVVFHVLDHATEQPYRGKYQNQDAEPVPAKFVSAQPVCSADGCYKREPCGPNCRDNGNFIKP